MNQAHLEVSNVHLNLITQDILHFVPIEIRLPRQGIESVI